RAPTRRASRSSTSTWSGADPRSPSRWRRRRSLDRPGSRRILGPVPTSPDERFSIAQVTPYGWEQHHEVNRFVERLSDELCSRGHRVVVVAPSDSRELIKDGRGKIRALKDDPDAVFDAPGCAGLLAVGQSLPFRRSGAVSLPLD